jgi:glycosyltransferase involved in cell wall biosynthesis
MAVVSVVMPAYNAARYIEAAIDSVLRQTFRDLELLVVDDGSTDTTAAIAEAARARDPRVRVILQPNGGVSKARNAAMREARGRYIALLDSDDLWDAGFLQSQIDLLESRPEIAIITGNALVLGGPRDGLPVNPSPDPRPHPTTEGLIADETAVFIMCVFRRTVYDAIGGFDESKATNEDYDYWIRASHAGFRFHRNDLPLGGYRWHADSLSANEVRMLRGILVVLNEHRPRTHGHPEEARILERQIARFETELLASEARAALEAGDYPSATRHLDALGARRRAVSLTIARVMVRRAPSLLAWLYRRRRAHLARSSARRHATA